MVIRSYDIFSTKHKNILYNILQYIFYLISEQPFFSSNNEDISNNVPSTLSIFTVWQLEYLPKIYQLFTLNIKFYKYLCSLIIIMSVELPQIKHSVWMLYVAWIFPIWKLERSDYDHVSISITPKDYSQYLTYSVEKGSKTKCRKIKSNLWKAPSP